jgi:radical SAM protein with 4Fe4S-binding SPASM domain
MEEDVVYIGRKPAYTEERNGKYLLVWDSIPNWVVVDEEACTFITALEGENTVVDIVEHFRSAAKTFDKAFVETVFTNLIDARILYKKRDSPPRFFLPPDKIMSVIIYPTNRCNLRCVMCYNTKNILDPKKKREFQKELTAEEFNNFLDQVKPFLAEDKSNLQIMGGEPLMVPEKTLEIIEHASSIVDHTSLATNGTLITREFAEELAALKHVNVQVSLDSPYKKNHEFLRGKGTFDRTIKGIKILVEEGVTTVTNMVVHTGNIEDLEQYYKLAIELGVTNARFIPLQLAGAGITCGLAPPPFPYLLENAFTILKENPQYRKLIGTDFLCSTARICSICGVQKWCGTGSRLLLLNADGTVYPCPNHHLPEFKAGNIREKSFEEIWEHSPVLQKIRKTYPVESINEECSSCYVRHWCAGWCRGETYQTTGHMTVPSVKCDEIKEMVIDMLFRLPDDHGVFGKLTKDFSKPLSMDRL